jgi:hypothetical protein
MGLRLAALAPLLACTLSLPAAAEKPFWKERERGLSLVGSTGLNGCTGDRCQNLGPLLHVRFHPAFRIVPFLSAGVHLGFDFKGPLWDHGGTRTELWDMLVGPEVRLLLPVRSLDIWAGLAFGYVHRKRLVVSEDYEHAVKVHAIGLAWGVGVDYFIVPGRLALGGDVWFTKGWNREFCSKTGDNDEICSTVGAVDEGTGLDIAAGASLTVFFGIGGGS